MKRFKTGRAFVFRYAVKLQFSVLFYPLFTPFAASPSPLSLSSVFATWVFCNHRAHSLSSKMPFINYKQRAPENKTLKNSIFNGGIFTSLHLFRCRLSRHEAFTRLLPCAQKQQESLTKDAQECSRSEVYRDFRRNAVILLTLTVAYYRAQLSIFWHIFWQIEIIIQNFLINLYICLYIFVYIYFCIITNKYENILY